MSTFGSAMRQAREYREMQYVELAVAMGRKRDNAPYLSSIERGKINPSVAVVVEIAKALDVTFACRPDGWSFRAVK